MVKVYFGTNRKPDPAQPGGFGADITPQNPSEVLYAVTDVQGILLDKEDTGTLGPIGNVTKGGYSDADTAEIIASPESSGPSSSCSPRLAQRPLRHVPRKKPEGWARAADCSSVAH